MILVSNLKIGYDDKIVVNEFGFEISQGEIVSLIGPNGSGKSTVLKVISRLMNKMEGLVHLDGSDIHSLPTKEVAKKLSILSQYNVSPPDFTVEELVGYGRMPHRKWYEQKSKEDEDIIKWAIQQTKLESLADRLINSLSGGEKQRTWIAMALAQKTKVLLLDEPTTYLDISHQIEVMELIVRLNKEFGMTVIMVLHDLNQAVRYSHRLMVIKNGRLVTEGAPIHVLTKEMLRDVYNVEAEIAIDKHMGKPVFFPIGLACISA
ncbi:ABC transporter ATP-binding protein [Candidatus Contubernalis alkaliaceticus]|uniref:ABC transporter ATP-binding protein n=1 Tax=Candidatus Contubernalis alkaliaceticus TaxID=338645 RepID=UPI001F4C43BC|nr:ABC transporter ATP-binding protein [Candidatus Contubernalis alkalaceticus]UNC93077.1 ABC transporter ATP-binding protein [Candidatus Contubernalis alkalaceticus]